MSKLPHTFKNDIVFKLSFVKRQDLLRRLVAWILGIKLESIVEFTVRNPGMPPDFTDGKFCYLDIQMTVNGYEVNLEVQIKDEKNFRERVMFHWARVYTRTLQSGEDYVELPHTIIISIVDFPLFDCEEFRSEFRPLEVSRYDLLSDKMCFLFFELKKLPKEIDGDDMLLLWLSLFRADTEEELEIIDALEVPELSDAIATYRSVTASEEFQELERMREKARIDEALALGNAWREGKRESDEEWKVVVADKDAEIADKDAVIADVKAELADKDAEIERLRIMLNNKSE